jgi:hypothetical protein
MRRLLPPLGFLRPADGGSPNRIQVTLQYVLSGVFLLGFDRGGKDEQESEYQT